MALRDLSEKTAAPASSGKLASYTYRRCFYPCGSIGESSPESSVEAAWSDHLEDFSPPRTPLSYSGGGDSLDAEFGNSSHYSARLGDEYEQEFRHRWNLDHVEIKEEEEEPQQASRLSSADDELRAEDEEDLLRPAQANGCSSSMVVVNPETMCPVAAAASACVKLEPIDDIDLAVEVMAALAKEDTAVPSAIISSCALSDPFLTPSPLFSNADFQQFGLSEFDQDILFGLNNVDAVDTEFFEKMSFSTMTDDQFPWIEEETATETKAPPLAAAETSSSSISIVKDTASIVLQISKEHSYCQRQHHHHQQHQRATAAITGSPTSSDPDADIDVVSLDDDRRPQAVIYKEREEWLKMREQQFKGKQRHCTSAPQIQRRQKRHASPVPVPAKRRHQHCRQLPGKRGPPVPLKEEEESASDSAPDNDTGNQISWQTLATAPPVRGAALRARAAFVTNAADKQFQPDLSNTADTATAYRFKSEPCDNSYAESDDSDDHDNNEEEISVDDNHNYNKSYSSNAYSRIQYTASKQRGQKRRAPSTPSFNKTATNGGMKTGTRGKRQRRSNSDLDEDFKPNNYYSSSSRKAAGRKTTAAVPMAQQHYQHIARPSAAFHSQRNSSQATAAIPYYTALTVKPKRNNHLDVSTMDVADKREHHNQLEKKRRGELKKEFDGLREALNITTIYDKSPSRKKSPRRNILPKDPNMSKRELHNLMEKERRENMKDLYDSLKAVLEQVHPKALAGKSLSKVCILRYSTEIIMGLWSCHEDVSSKLEQRRRENKILQQRLLQLKQGNADIMRNSTMIKQEILTDNDDDEDDDDDDDDDYSFEQSGTERDRRRVERSARKW